MNQIAKTMLCQALALAAAGTHAATTPEVRPTPWATSAFDAMRNADALPADAGHQPAPTTLVWRLQSREAGMTFDSHVQSMTLMPGRSPGGTASRHVQHDASGPLWCFETAGNRFDDGSWRFTGRLLDAQCKALLADPRSIVADGKPYDFSGRLPNGKNIAIDLVLRRFALPANFVWVDVGIQHNLRALAPAGMRLVGPIDQPMRLRARHQAGDAREALAVDLMTTPEGVDHARIKARLLLGDPERLLAEPVAVTRWDEPARLVWDDPATGRRVELRLTPHRNRSKAAPFRP